jgi:hypothetical protein
MTNTTWGNWTSSTTYSTAVSTASVWYTWTTGTASATAVSTAPWGWTTTSYTTNGAWTAWVETAEQAEARKVREAEYRANQAERDRLYREQAALQAEERAKADATAEKLLLEWLAEEEVARYRRAGYFFVISESGKKYKIKKGSHGNVYLIDPETEKEKVSYCVQPGGVPIGDVNLAQALFLKHNEAEFLQKANARQLMN